jgi:nitrite reductase (NADH) small subunit/3-phenylpropionate/trans-cinnamate dioxygenase ferredoxin subunit
MQDGIVTCPWHAWRFCYHDGNWCDNPSISIDTFPVQVQDDEIQVDVRPRD